MRHTQATPESDTDSESLSPNPAQIVLDIERIKSEIDGLKNSISEAKKDIGVKELQIKALCQVGIKAMRGL